jgi:excisionase family DNA binding protein
MELLEDHGSGKIYSVRTAGAILGSPRVTVIRWIREGKLRAFKFPDGRLWRIRESDLLAFIDGGEEVDLE